MEERFASLRHQGLSLSNAGMNVQSLVAIASGQLSFLRAETMGHLLARVLHRYPVSLPTVPQKMATVWFSQETRRFFGQRLAMRSYPPVQLASALI